MATSGYFNTGNYQGRYLLFSWSISSQSVTSNTTTISWTLKGAGTASSSWYKAGNFKVVIDGKTVYSTSESNRIKLYDGTTVASGTYTMTHKDDGTRSFSASAQAGIYTYAVNKSGSGSWDLTTIPRKSTVSANHGLLGEEQTLTVTRKSTSFTHTITATCGSASTTVCTKSTSTSIKFTPPISWASNNKTGTDVTVKYTITTYSGSTSIGSSSYTISYSIPSSVKPSVSLAVSDPMGHKDTFGAYVQGQSKLKIVATASGSQGSTIKSYKTEADGKTYTAASVTSGVIAGTGTLTIKVTVTDSRGRTETASTKITVLAYKPPQVSELVVYRCKQNAVADPAGQYLAVDFDASVTALGNKNSATYTLKYKKQTDSEYTTENLAALSGTYVIYGATSVFQADTASSYNVSLSVTDSFASTQKTAVGSSVKKVWSLLKKAGEIVGYAIGKVAELEGVLDIAVPVKFREGIIQNVLWSGVWYMADIHTAELSEPISKQPSGIVLVFSEYISGAESDTAFHTRFIPKTLVATHPGRGHCIQLSSSNLDFFATKYLYIHDDKIVGHANNNMIGTGDCGISFNNQRFVLRYVIGV